MTINRKKLLAVGKTVSDLRAKFIPHGSFIELKDQFDLLLYQRRAEIDAGRHDEARGIMLVGNSGAGKSKALTRLFEKHDDLQLLKPGVTKAEVVGMTVPSPATLKDVGRDALGAIGYPIQRDRSAGIMWGLFQTHLQQRQTLFFHLDEAQDLHINRNTREMQSVVNTLKSIMQNPYWPTGIILSGMPKLKELMHLDRQLSRRFVPVHFAPISFTTHAKIVGEMVVQYANSAKFSLKDDLLNSEFLKRLIHSGADELGIVIEMIIGAIQSAMLSDKDMVDHVDFAAAFRRRSGCVDDLNPFIAEDFIAIDARLLLDAPEEEEDLLAPYAKNQRKAA